MKKRILSILLVFVMAAGLMPGALPMASAAEPGKIGEYGLDTYHPSLLNIVRDTTINPDNTVSVTFKLKDDLDALMPNIVLRFRYDTEKMTLKNCSTEDGVFSGEAILSGSWDYIPFSVNVLGLYSPYPAGDICTLTFEVKKTGSTDVFGDVKQPYWWVDLGGVDTHQDQPVSAFAPDTSNFYKVSLYAGTQPEIDYDPVTYTVTYIDGTDDAEIFADKSQHVEHGEATPDFGTDPTRPGYTFDGWSPSVAPTVTEDVTYVAQWKKEAEPEPEPEPDPPYGTARLTKVDAGDNSTVLDGVVFELYRENGRRLGTYTTNSRGRIIVPDLLSGSYYWKEIRSAEGYILDSSAHPFTISAYQTTSVVIENKKSAVPDGFTTDHYAYIIGSDDGLVHPEANITRAEVAAIFFRLLDEETRNMHMTSQNSFTDVNGEAWYNTAASTMAAMGIITGRPGNTFAPNANITRAEFAAIAARFDASGDTTAASFTDISHHWAEEEINIAANNGWVLGGEDGIFSPDRYITRAEAMTMVNRVLQRIPESTDDLLADMILWPDNMDTSKWYYLMVQEATNGHDHLRKENGYESWVALWETPDWASLER